MKFSVIAATLAAVSSAAVIPRTELPAGQQPLPAKFRLTFSSDLPEMNSEVVPKIFNYNPDFPYRVEIYDPVLNEADPQPVTFSGDGDRIFLVQNGVEYLFGMDVSGYALFDIPGRVPWTLPYQPGTFGQVDGLLAYNAGDGHGPPTTQWKACGNSWQYSWKLVWNRPECEPIMVYIVPVEE